jgi:hypothetical protein
MATRLLRRPFAPPPTRKIPARQRQSNLIISHNGRKLAFYADHVLYLHSIPGSSNAKPGRVKTLTFPLDQELVAVNISRKRLCAITQDSGYWYYYRFPDAPEVQKQNKSQRIPSAEGGIAPFFFDQTKEGNRLLLLDAQQRVRSLQLPPEKNLFQAIAQRVIYLGDCGIGPCYAQCSEIGQIDLFWFLGSEKPCRVQFPAIQNQNPGFFLHASGGWSKCQVGAVAVEQATDRWLLQGHRHQREVHLQSGDQVCGVLHHVLGGHGQGLHLWLIVHNPGEQAVYALSDQERHSLLENCGAIDQVSLNPRHPYLHYVSEAGEDLVYCLHRQEVLMRLSGASES